ncbi:sensor histidine kinase [Metabacillus malikii]|uniref:histidine kinase n=1 Tax=Metabacillus malikii TaxID=1504265 RepID=A0ABT9ZL72_9BACI|nr:sensor histidine kinase [Metabacillus malikii]MDQ0232536.1 two-component system sensor histidine kinase YesM [Metabacillus malikii]
MKNKITNFVLYLHNMYNNSKIKYKLITIISIIMLICLLFTVVGFQFAFNMYDQQIYRKSSQVLIMSSKQIEDELTNIEELSFNILKDSVLQSHLTRTKEEISKYEQFQIESEIWEKLTSFIGNEKYIQSIYLYDQSGREYRAGSNHSKRIDKMKDVLIDKAVGGNGSNVWVSDAKTNNYIYSTRQIKAYKNLSLEFLATLIIEVNLDEIIKELPKVWDGHEGGIIISNRQGPFYREENIFNYEHLVYSTADSQGYFIQKVKGRSFFITYFQSPYSDWTYWNIIPFGSMFAKVTAMKYIVIFIFLLLYSGAIFLAVKFSRHITNPIENLVSSMKNVQQGDFNISETLKLHDYGEKDEVGILHHNFYTMIERINELIKENYEKQLLIKDTEFKALQSQINPHFLYNTLESINWLAKINKQQQISNMVESLGYLLRNAISIKEDVITLREEIEIVNHYVTIQKFRFEERLNFNLYIDEQVLDCKLPKLIIQPLVENSINYGLESMIECCHISVSAYKADGNIHLIVEDNGVGIDENQISKIIKGNVNSKGNGIGIKNIDSRIKLVFGEEYGVKIESTLNLGTKVIIVIPCETR